MNSNYMYNKRIIDTWLHLPAENSRTTTTVMTAQIALLPMSLKRGSMRYNKETSVKEIPTLRACITLLGSSFPTSQSLFGIFLIFSEGSNTFHLLFLKPSSISVLPTWTLLDILRERKWFYIFFSLFL